MLQTVLRPVFPGKPWLNVPGAAQRAIYGLRQEAGPETVNQSNSDTSASCFPLDSCAKEIWKPYLQLCWPKADLHSLLRLLQSMSIMFIQPSLG